MDNFKVRSKNSLLKQSVVIALLLAASRSEALAADGELRGEFADPPPRWRSHPLWFWNGKLDAAKTRGMVSACKAAGYHGMGILPSDGMGFDFMSPEFLRQYKVFEHVIGKEGPVTRVHVKIASVRSLFLVAADTGNTKA